MRGQRVGMRGERKAGSLGVVITGGSAGLGYALAAGFLSAGDRVVICGRDQQRLEDAVQSLRQGSSRGEVYGIGCDVGDPLEVRALAAFAVARLGQVDRWINNAGTAGKMKRPLWELQADDVLETCSTNLSGSILLCREAVLLMACQPPSQQPRYHIFNMGFSFTGARFSRSAVPHKASKLGVAELTRSLYEELKAANNSSIGVHELSPGLVLTELLLKDASPEALRVLASIAERPEKVAALLVPKIRSASGRYNRIRYQPLAMLFLRMISFFFWRPLLSSIQRFR